MPVIDMQGAVVPDPWVEGDPADRAEAEPLLLSLDALTELTSGEIEEARPVGVRVPPGADIDPLLAVLDRLQLIVIQFPSFRDGRGFTLATTLRNRYGFKGELRVAGYVLPDQLSALRQCGFTTIETSANHPPELWRNHASVTGGDGPLLKRLLAIRSAPAAGHAAA